MKYKILLLLIVLLGSLSVVYAGQILVTVESITVVEKSDTISLEDTTFTNNEITSSIVFNNLDDYVKYDLIIRNNDDKDYYIKKIEDNNTNNNIKIEYNYPTEKIGKDETATINITVKYNNQLKNVDSIELNDLTIVLTFDDGTVVINPSTSDNIIKYISILFISLLILILLVMVKNKKINKKYLLLLLLILLPIKVKGVEICKLNLKFKSIEIKGVFEIYDVEVDPGNGEATTSMQIQYGDTVGSLTAPVKEGYTFVGWVDANSNPVSEDTVVTGDMVITAQYNIIQYNITYNLNGGNGSNDNNYTILEEVVFNNPSRGGYNFGGWYLNEDFSGDAQTKIEVGTTGDKEYYAKWNLINYTITYHLNDGILGPDALNSYNIETDTFNLPFPEKENYHFKGWYTKEDLTGNLAYEIEVGTIGNKEYYAKWEEYKSYIGYDVYDVLKDEAISDAERSLFVPRDEGIDFSNGSGISNGVGKYVVDSTKNDTYPIYYYRGEVKDNNVIFGDYCWLIVRTTNTGGTKLVYNGVAEDGKCLKTGTDTFVASGIKYNSTYSRVGAIGYTYNGSYVLTGTTLAKIYDGYVFGNNVVYEDGKYILQDLYVKDANFENDADAVLSTHHYTCLSTESECTTVMYIYMGRSTQLYYTKLSSGETIEDVIENRNFNVATATNSTIKTYIDNWYSNNMTSKTDKLEDTVWCNDRSIYIKGGWDRNGSLYDEKVSFGALGRLSVDKQPSLVCANVNDRYTVSEENGNGGLTYPVGLLTADEVALGGYGWFQEESTSYLNNGHIWWTMSPSLLSANYAYVDVAYSMLDNVHTGYVTTSSGISSGGVRPSISLNKDVVIVSGSGTKNDPYRVNE